MEQEKKYLGPRNRYQIWRNEQKRTLNRATFPTLEYNSSSNINSVSFFHHQTWIVFPDHGLTNKPELHIPEGNQGLVQANGKKKAIKSCMQEVIQKVKKSALTFPNLQTTETKKKPTHPKQNKEHR